jgi:hypothetical protein
MERLWLFSALAGRFLRLFTIAMIHRLLVPSTTMTNNASDFDFFLEDTRSKPRERTRQEPPSDDYTSMYDIVEACFAEAPYQEKDTATASLALLYAEEIDNDGDLIKLGPLLLNVLEALHMSPRARSAAKKGLNSGSSKPESTQRSVIDEIAERRSRKSGA